MSDQDPSFSLEETMEEAIDTLQHTICLAQICQKKSDKHSREMFSHVKALEEDLAALTITRTPVPQTLDLAKQTKKTALHLKRTLEREALTLHRHESEAATTTAQPAPFADTSSTKDDHRQIKLHALKVPVFTGEPSQFRLFFDIFNDNVENNPKLTETAKWVYLDESVKGAAAELIAKIPRQPATRRIALQTLETQYGGIDHTVCDLYQQLQSLPAATMQDNSLRFTQAQIEGLLLSLETLNHRANENEFIKSVVKGKFPIEFLHLVIPEPEADNLKQIRINLQRIVTARQRVTSNVIHTTPTTSTSSNAAVTSPSRPTRTTRTTTQRPLRCMFCSGPHYSDECTKYPTITARQARIPDRCLKCFRPKHDGNCLTEKRCAHCDDPNHNRALCPKKFLTEAVLYTHPTSESAQTTLPPPTDGTFLTFLLSVSSCNQPLAQPICAMIDSGGAKSILTTDVARCLKVDQIPGTKLALSGLGRADLPGITPAAQSIYLHANNDTKIEIPVHLTPLIADDLPTTDIEVFRTQYPEQSQIYIPPTGAGQRIDLLIGKDALAAICVLHTSIYVSPHHQLLGTKFGHLIVGNTITTPTQRQPTQLYFAAPPSDDLRNLWELDTLGLHDIQQKDSEQEERTIQNFYKTIEFVDGHYQLGWPFKTSPPLLPTNYGLALGRLKSVWNRLHTDHELLLTYHQTITDQITKGVVEPVPPNEPPTDNTLHYIPHHPVIRTDKSTKLRIVYDASAKPSKTAKSLNENLYAGGNWVKDLFTILIRLRVHETVITADIEKAFLQIKIRPQDRDAMRFLWLHDPLKPPEPSNIWPLRFCRMAFGVLCSPFLLAATIQHHLKHNPHEFNDLILQNLYADNLVLSLPTDIDPLKFYRYVKEIFESMGMNMAQWTTNNTTLQHDLPPHDYSPADRQSILGLTWNIHNDTLQLKSPSNLTPTNRLLTKRIALQQMASLFDPLGLATPMILRAKLFIRKLWDDQVNWDEQLFLTRQKEWYNILADLQHAKHIVIPRRMFPIANVSDITTLQLHVFADASADAYATVIYARALTTSSSYITFIASKNRLTPKKSLTIPRLELLAILISCRFSQFVLQSLQWHQTPEITIWSDSKCALAWVKNTKILPHVIQRQVTEIHTFHVHAFRHVDSANNFADIATRGATYDQLQNMKWWQGPKWLTNEADWPSDEPDPPETIDNIHKATELLFTKIKTPTNILPDQLRGLMSLDYAAFSNLRRLLLRVAYCCKALNLMLKKKLLNIDADLDTEYAEYLLIRYEQQHAFPIMYDQHPPPNTIGNIRVFLDPSDIIRCRSRIPNAQSPSPTSEPILLVKGSKLTTLIIMQAHEQMGHAGTSHTLAQIRKRLWLPHGRREIFKTVRKNCYRCKRFATHAYATPNVPPLPEFRATQTERPFEAIGLDVFGPYQVRLTTPQSLTKNWVIIATCAVTRAIHLELLTDMSTAALIDAIRRLVARRGTPKIIVADNAPQFKKLDEALQKIWETIADQPQAVSYFAEHRIKWKFLPPESPWMGGFYERLVGIIKNAFDKTYNTKILLQRQFETSMIEIEGILNSRPLTYVDCNLDTKIITPLEFLRIKYPALPITHSNDNDHDRTLHLWHASQQYVDEFWATWSTQYLLQLRERDDKLKAKTTKSPTGPAVGDLVLLVDPEKRRNAWQLAVIETLILSNDGQTRSALVHLGNNRRLIRPLVKLAPLGLTSQTFARHPSQFNPENDTVTVDEQPFSPPSDEDQVIEIDIDDDW